MSLKAIREVLRSYEKRVAPKSYGAALLGEAREELEGVERAAKTLTRLYLGDMADTVAHREHVIQAMTDDPASQWNHPDVVAWSDAAQLLAAIAKEAE